MSLPPLRSQRSEERRLHVLRAMPRALWSRPPGPITPNSRTSLTSTCCKTSEKSNYNGLQTTITQRTSHGLSYTVGYTFSHALDNASDNWSCCIPIYGNVKPLYGNSVFDITHRGTISVTYNLPGKKGFGQMLEGWQLNSVLTLQSGLPWGVSDTGNDFSGTGEVSQTNEDGQGEQWNFFGNPKDFQITHGFSSNPVNGDILSGGTGGVPFYGGSGDATTGAETTNAACNAKAEAMGPAYQAALSAAGCYALGGSMLLPPAIGTFGTMGRNIWRDAGFRQWDMSLFKNVVSLGREKRPNPIPHRSVQYSQHHQLLQSWRPGWWLRHDGSFGRSWIRRRYAHC